MSTKATADKKESDRQKRAAWESFSFAVARPEDTDGPGRVNVANHSHGDEKGHTYTVTVTDGTATACTCPDHKYRDSRCKHRRVVEATQPVLMAATGPSKAVREATAKLRALAKTTTDAPTVTGPHVGLDRYGNPDHEFYRCEECGDEAIHTGDLRGHDCEGL